MGLLPLFFTGGFSAIWKALMARLFGEKKSPEAELAKHDQTIAQKQAADLADRTQSDAIDRLSGHEF